jgi:N-methylhydantoinase A/oxoprolinase/acetone carboxylase beta subunit
MASANTPTVRVGVDVGGTNTDLVLVKEGRHCPGVPSTRESDLAQDFRRHTSALTTCIASRTVATK